MPGSNKNSTVGSRSSAAFNTNSPRDGGDEEDIPSDEEGDGFDWDRYLSETNLTAALPDCFWQAPVPPVNKFEVGQKLEAVDPRNSTITSVATVVALYGPKIKLHLDGTAKVNDFWVLADSSRIHQFGYTEEHGGHVQPPLCYEKDPVRYQTQIINAAKESGCLAPKTNFVEEPTRPPHNQFKIGTKLEATDSCDPTWICPATVVGREREKIRIEYDGWGQTDLIRYDSRDLYPCGWWQKAGIKISKPPNTKKRTGPRRARRLSSGSVSRASSSASGQARVATVDPPTTDFHNIFDSVLAKATAHGIISPPIEAPVIELSSGRPQSTSSAVADTADQSNLTPALVSSAPPSPSAASTPMLPRHAARKSIPPQRKPTPPVVAVAANSEHGRSATPKDTSGQSNGESAYQRISQPDVMIKANDKGRQATKVSFYMNKCACGPFLDANKMTRRFDVLMTGEQPMPLAIRDAFQLLIDSARSDCAQHILDTIPTADVHCKTGLSVFVAGQDSTAIIRYLPMFETLTNAKKAVQEVLAKLKACPNLLSTVKTDCDVCCEPPTKKTKSTGECCSVDMIRKINPTETQSSNKTLDNGDGVWQWFGQDPTKWSVEEVVQFIATVVDPQAADMFGRQEIDGPALVLLTPDILIKCMDVRVGPAVKIFNAIERLKGTNRPTYGHTSCTVHPQHNTGNGKGE